MKTCGYCGRENEDSAVACRECGLNEFSLPVIAQPPEIPYEPEIPDPDVASGQEAALCPFCLFPNLPERKWCKCCGSPFNTSTTDPFEAALAGGSMWRGVVRGRQRPIVFVLIWIWFPAVFLMGAANALGGLLSGQIWFICSGLLSMAFSGSILAQVTRNFATIPEPKLDE